MKTLFFLAIALTLAASAQAAPRLSTIEQLKREASSISEVLESNRSCQLFVEETREGLELLVREQSGKSANLHVAQNAIITLDSDEIERDETTSDTFTVRGEGSIRLIVAPEAYESAEITDRDGNVASCQIHL